MYRFIIARHGESIWNQDSKFTGWTNIPLTFRGKEEAHDMAVTLQRNKINPTIFFSSVLARSIDTSTIIQKTFPNATIHTSWRLNEKHYGTLEGIPRQYIRELYGDLFTKMMRSSYNMKPPIVKPSSGSIYPVYKNCYFETIKNGESKEDVLKRLLPYYENDILYTLNEQHTPFIVTHKHTMRVLMKHLLQMNEETFEQYELPSKKMIVVELNNTFQYVTHHELSYEHS